MATTNDIAVERCARHDCCIRVPRIATSPEASHLAGEWHLRWFPDDRSWFLAPPQGNIHEVLVRDGEDPTDALVIDGVMFDDVRRAIHRGSLFPPC